MKLIVGLGNPGDKYIKVRHNLGFMTLDEYAKKHLGPIVNWKIDGKFKSEIIKLNKDLWLVKPQTFMNASGMAVSVLANYLRVKPENVIIVHDELDLKLGQIKVRIGGAAGGHHGVESVMKELGTDQFIRVRLGVGNLKSHSSEHNRVHFNAEHFVLESFMPNEKSQVKHMIKQAIDCLDLLLDKSLEVVQNQYN